MATRAAVDQLLRRRFFYTESFSIYQQAPNFAEDIRGLFDLGPPGTALQNNILKLWRHHFVIHDGMLEIECPILTPTEVLKTSGHTDRFTDLMCKDTKTNDSLRADHLIEEVIEARLANKGKAFDPPKAAKNAPPPAPHTNQVKLDDTHMQEYKEILAKVLATLYLPAMEYTQLALGVSLTFDDSFRSKT